MSILRVCLRLQAAAIAMFCLIEWSSFETLLFPFPIWIGIVSGLAGCLLLQQALRLAPYRRSVPAGDLIRVGCRATMRAIRRHWSHGAFLVGCLVIFAGIVTGLMALAARGSLPLPLATRLFGDFLGFLLTALPLGLSFENPLLVEPTSLDVEMARRQQAVHARLLRVETTEQISHP